MTTGPRFSDRAMNRLLYALLAVVVYLFYGELSRVWNSRQESLWDERYIAAVRAGPEEWTLGWRLEDLESRLHMQRFWAEPLQLAADAFGALRREDSAEELRAKVESLKRVIEDDASFATMQCISRPGRLVHVGPDEFRDMHSDRCRVFSSLEEKLLGPHAIWEVVPLDEEEGAVGFRALSNGLFLRVKAPDPDGSWNDPWLLETASPLPGLAERFILKEATPPPFKEEVEYTKNDFFNGDGDDWGSLNDGYRRRRLLTAENIRVVTVYSELMRGYLHCDGGGLSEAVKGVGSESALAEDQRDVFFSLKTVTPVELGRARNLKASSRHIFQSRVDAGEREQEGERPLTIALVVPMTSKGTDMDSVGQSPFWYNLFASFVESIDWRENKHRFVFYLGFDRADTLYDTGDAWTEMRAAFKTHARKALTWLGYGKGVVRRILQDHKHPMLDIKLNHFDGTSGAPSHVVSKLSSLAVKEGADYVYQLNDDTILVSKDWLSTYVSALQRSPLGANVGVAGPLDTTNERILTHAFVHATHIHIFNGLMFPIAFKNWWSDDWISAVYGSLGTFARRDVVVTHNVQSQKTGAWNRYEIDHSDHMALHTELQRGFLTINSWLRDKASFNTMPLPDVCGYSPMLTRIYDTLIKKTPPKASSSSGGSSSSSSSSSSSRKKKHQRAPPPKDDDFY